MGSADMKVNSEEVILTAPLTLEGAANGSYKAPNVVKRILSLFANVRPGADLTRFQLPPLFNIPKSQLQCYGEMVYCEKNDLLRRCESGESSIDRMMSVVAWNLSTIRPLVFGFAPYNPILGETHHVSRSTLNVFLEQVSHHPPVTAMHATDESSNVELLWCQNAVPKFYGASIETVVHGKRTLNLVKRGETYVMNSPKLLIRLFPIPGVDWVGNVKIECQQTGLHAELAFRGSSYLGFGGGSRSVRGKIFTSSLKTLYEIDGQWDRTVRIKDTRDGKTKVLYDAKDTISSLSTPTLRDPKGVMESESAAVWSEVSKGILSKDWEKAKEAKKAIEEKEREVSKQRISGGQIWKPKYFDLSYSPENGWDCIPKQNTVPPAPIIFPI